MRLARILVGRNNKMTFSSSKHKREAGKSTVVKYVVLSNKFINTSPSFYFKYKLFKSYRLHQSRIKFLVKILTREKGKKKNDHVEPRIPSSEVAVLLLAIRMNRKN